MGRSAILCVDDEKIILDSLRTQIRNAFQGRYITEFAEGAEEAFEVINEIREDHVDTLVVISDWLMPEMKGDELLIKIHEKFPNTVNIMLTGHAEGVAVENARKNANLYACLSKPWQKEDLIRTIESAIKSKV